MKHTCSDWKRQQPTLYFCVSVVYNFEVVAYLWDSISFNNIGPFSLFFVIPCQDFLTNDLVKMYPSFSGFSYFFS